MKSDRPTDESAWTDQGPHFVEASEPGDRLAWEEIEPGRYLPRRIRGSNRGRALG